MKLRRDSKVVKGLQDLINICAENALYEPRIVQKIDKHKTRVG